ncbi:MAG: hypothetical protein ACK5SP_02155 [bacterium]|jgi:hypothetical protein
MTYRFCTSCQVDRPSEGGIVKLHKTNKRWICRLCVARKNPSIYSNKQVRADFRDDDGHRGTEKTQQGADA